MASPTAETRWQPLSPEAVAELFGSTTARWWLSGGVALDRWMGAPIRERDNIDVSTLPRDLPALTAALPETLSAWAHADDEPVPLTDAAEGADLQPVRLYDSAQDAWVLQINLEDGTDRVWLYLRDPRLQLPWDAAVLDIGGIPVGAPQVQLVWKALRPRPEDEIDKDAVLPKLSEHAVKFYETALLRIHPHSTWAIHVRSPFAPAKASWNRKNV